jgi:hypothetical protein
VKRHVSEMLFAQLFHAMGLHCVCDWLLLKSGVLACFGATPPIWKGLYSAKKERSAEFPVELFWFVLMSRCYESTY